MERQQTRSGRPQNPLQELSDRIARLESMFNSNLGVLFRNHQQLKHGLDAAEVNQRAMVKVVQDLCRGLGVTWPVSLEGVDQPKKELAEADVVFPVSMLLNSIDWGKYYRSAEDDITAERIAAYKAEIIQLVTKVDKVEAGLPDFEQGLKRELKEAGVLAEEHPRAVAVIRFLNELKAEMAKVRKAAEDVAKDEVTKEKMTEINVRVIQDALHMIANQKLKKETEDKSNKVGHLVEPSAEEIVTQEFGG